ncbi:MAG: Uma2 family endonuclease [Gemmataceae bacterium]
MTALLTPPPTTPMSGLRPFRWTVQLFHRLGDLGVFEGRRASLWDGQIVEEGPMNPPHRIALELTDGAMRAAFGAGWRVCVQMPLILSPTDAPQPDVAVVKGSPRDSAVHPTSAELVIEIADSSLSQDLTEKAEKYATAGIADYWVLDVDGRQLFVFRDPVPLPAGLGATAYATRFTRGPADAVAPLALPSASIAVADLLP